MESENRDTVVSTLVSVMKARGAFDPALQRIVVDHCRSGNVDLMEQALAEYLIADGLTRSVLPAPTHPITQRMAERAIAAVTEILTEYLAKGGVLLARRFSTPKRMQELMLRRWKDLKLRQLRNTQDLPTYDEEHERIARASVAAQALLALLHRTDPDRGEESTGFFIPDDKVEDFCMRAVTAMFVAYQAPDEWISERLGNR